MASRFYHLEKCGASASEIEDGSFSPVPLVTVGAVLELKELKECRGCSWTVCSGWLQALYGNKWPRSGPIPNSTLSTAIKRLEHQVKQNKQLVYVEFVVPGDKPISLSSGSTGGVSVTVSDTGSVCSSSDFMPQPVPPEGDAQSALAREVFELREKLTESKQCLEKSLEQEGSLRKKVKSLQAKVRRRQSDIASIEGELGSREKQHYAEVRVLKKKVSYLGGKIASVAEKSSSSESEGDDVFLQSLESEKQELLDQKRELENELCQREEECEDLREQLHEAEEKLGSKFRIETFDLEQNKYKDNVRQCCMELLSNNVSLARLAPVIRSVSSLLFNCEVPRLPSAGMLSSLLVEMKQISQIHAATEIAKDAYTTLHTDATSKFGQKYTGFQATTATGTYSLGMSEMDIGSAARTLDVMKEMLQSVDQCCKSAGVLEGACSKMVANMKNTMSDRGSVEVAFNNLYDEFRATVVPECYENWAALSQEAQASILRVNHFYCGLHFLVGMAEVAEKALFAWEKTQLEDEGVNEDVLRKGESGTHRLIYTACKALTKHGSEQAGCHAAFMAFLSDKGVNMPLVDFRGNRFNILFFNAAGLWQIRDLVSGFLSDSHGTTNRLLQAVASDLRVPEFLAGCRALGIVRKLITGPLWRVLEDESSVADMSAVYQALHASFESWANDASTLLDGSGKPFPECSIEVDNLSDELFSPHENDASVQVVLQLLCAAFSTLSSRQLADHLTGGKYGEFEDSVAKEVQSVPKTNRASEKDFAQLDRLVREKPNASLVAMEGLILFANNKTSSWLSQLSPEERKAIFTAASSSSSLHRAMYKKRKAEIVSARLKVLKEKEQKKKQREEKEERERIELATAIAKDGFWTSRSIIEDKLRELPTDGSRVKALKIQIKYRKQILRQQPVDKGLFSFSKAGKVLKWPALAENLGQLAEPLSTTTPAAPPTTQTVTAATAQTTSTTTETPSTTTPATSATPTAAVPTTATTITTPTLVASECSTITLQSSTLPPSVTTQKRASEGSDTPAATRPRLS